MSHPRAESAVRNRLLLVAAALLFSTGGAVFKAASITAWQTASFRSGVAALVLLAAFPEARRWRWNMLPVAAAYAATLILFVLANRLTTSANAIFLQSTSPIYVLLLGPLLLRESIRRADLYYIVAVAAGLVLFFAGRDTVAATATDPPRGNLLALASGVTYALMLVGMRWHGREGGQGSGIAIPALGNLVAFVAALPMALPVESFTARDAAVILYLGVAQIGLAYWCLTRAIRQVPAFEATTTLQLEPAMSPVWSWLAHGERPTPWALAGGVLIVSATLVNTWFGRRRDQR